MSATAFQRMRREQAAKEIEEKRLAELEEEEPEVTEQEETLEPEVTEQEETLEPEVTEQEETLEPVKEPEKAGGKRGRSSSKK